MKASNLIRFGTLLVFIASIIPAALAETELTYMVSSTLENVFTRFNDFLAGGYQPYERVILFVLLFTLFLASFLWGLKQFYKEQNNQIVGIAIVFAIMASLAIVIAYENFTFASFGLIAMLLLFLNLLLLIYSLMLKFGLENHKFLAFLIALIICAILFLLLYSALKGRGGDLFGGVGLGGGGRDFFGSIKGKLPFQGGIEGYFAFEESDEFVDRYDNAFSPQKKRDLINSIIDLGAKCDDPEHVVDIFVTVAENEADEATLAQSRIIFLGTHVSKYVTKRGTNGYEKRNGIQATARKFEIKCIKQSEADKVFKQEVGEEFEPKECRQVVNFNFKTEMYKAKNLKQNKIDESGDSPLTQYRKFFEMCEEEYNNIRKDYQNKVDDKTNTDADDQKMADITRNYQKALFKYHSEMGTYLAEAGKFDEALGHFRIILKDGGEEHKEEAARIWNDFVAKYWLAKENEKLDKLRKEAEYNAEKMEYEKAAKKYEEIIDAIGYCHRDKNDEYGIPSIKETPNGLLQIYSRDWSLVKINYCTGELIDKEKAIPQPAVSENQNLPEDLKNLQLPLKTTEQDKTRQQTELQYIETDTTKTAESNSVIEIGDLFDKNSSNYIGP